MLTTKVPGDRRRVDPAAVVAWTCRPACFSCSRMRHEPGILVGADALIALVRTRGRDSG